MFLFPSISLSFAAENSDYLRDLQINGEECQQNQRFKDDKDSDLEKESCIQKMDIKLIDGQVLNIRKDVLGLFPFFEGMLNFADCHDGEVFCLPDFIKPEAAKRVFSYIESKLTPDLSGNNLFINAGLENNTLPFIKKNIDVLSILHFFNIDWKFKVKLSLREGGGYAYDIHLPATKENIGYFVGHDIIRALSSNEERSKFSLLVESLEDVKFILDNYFALIYHFCNEYPAEILIFNDPYLLFEISNDDLVSLLERGYKLSFFHRHDYIYADPDNLKKGNFSLQLKTDNLYWLKNYHEMKEGYLKNFIRNLLLSKEDFNYCYVGDVNYLPDDIFNHMKEHITPSDRDITNILDALKKLEDNPRATQGYILEKLQYLKSFEEFKRNGDIKIETVDSLKKLKDISDELLHQLSFKIKLEKVYDSNYYISADDSVVLYIIKNLNERRVPIKFDIGISLLTERDMNPMLDALNFPNVHIVNQSIKVDERIKDFPNVLIGMKNLQTIEIRVSSAANLKTILSHLPKDLTEIRIDDSELREASAVRTDNGNRYERMSHDIPKYDRLSEKIVFDMVKTLDEFQTSARKIFTTKFQGYVKFFPENKGNFYERVHYKGADYDFDKLRNQLRECSSRIIINLNQNGFLGKLLEMDTSSLKQPEYN